MRRLQSLGLCLALHFAVGELEALPNRGGGGGGGARAGCRAGSGGARTDPLRSGGEGREVAVVVVVPGASSTSSDSVGGVATRVACGEEGLEVDAERLGFSPVLRAHRTRPRRRAAIRGRRRRGCQHFVPAVGGGPTAALVGSAHDVGKQRHEIRWHLGIHHPFGRQEQRRERAVSSKQAAGNKDEGVREKKKKKNVDVQKR